MKVIKFGGSSLASATQLNKVLKIVQDDPTRKFVVVSAPGKRNADDEKVTDMLIQYAENFLASKDVTDSQAKIVKRYADMVDELALPADILATIKEAILNLANMDRSNPDRVMDAFKASGEDNNAKLIAAFFTQSGVPAIYKNPKDAGIIVTDEPGNAQILPSSYAKIHEMRNIEQVVIIPGFFGYTQAGDVCTFSRGGSDITGSIVAAGVKADIYENFTDVDAIYAAHPGIVHAPYEIHEMTYRELRELAYAGFAVFHDEALMPAYRAGIPVNVKNTNNPVAPGTMIKTHRETYDEPVVGIAGDEGFASIYINKYLMNREIGFGRKVLQILEDLHVRFEHMPSGIDDISVIVRECFLTPEIEEELLTRLEDELTPDEVRITHGLSVVMVVGENMKNQVGVAAAAVNSLSANGVNLEMINQGSSEVSIMFAIKSEMEKRAIRALYDAYFA